MKRKPTLSKHVNKDVVLCETTNRLVSKRTTNLLLESSVPFSKSWKRVPFFKRRDYNGASEVCVFSISRTQYCNARRVISMLETRDYERLLLNLL